MLALNGNFHVNGKPLLLKGKKSINVSEIQVFFDGMAPFHLLYTHFCAWVYFELCQTIFPFELFLFLTFDSSIQYEKKLKTSSHQKISIGIFNDFLGNDYRLLIDEYMYVLQSMQCNVCEIVSPSSLFKYWTILVLFIYLVDTNLCCIFIIIQRSVFTYKVYLVNTSYTRSYLWILIFSIRKLTTNDFTLVGSYGTHRFIFKSVFIILCFRWLQ